MIQYLTIVLQGHQAKMDERGASAVEHGLLIAGIAAVIAAAVYLFGGITGEMFSNSCETLKSHMSPSATCS